ncbi:MAG: exonuclease domain-containing protein [Lachnospiraceae bacterium]|nr:exonuclease domain-containing protein [Lachnospiraceae bacterium]
MYHVVIDLEMNEILKEFEEQRKISSYETIEIGAIILDDNYEEIAEYKTYVKPEINEILPPYVDITGITNETVSDSRSFNEVMPEFIDWIYNVCGTEYKIYSWSMSDYHQIKYESKLKKYEDNRVAEMLSKWVDFQEVFGKIIGARKRVSLKDAVFYVGNDFQGQMHDALCDARNTGLLLKLSRNREEMLRILAPLIKAYKPKENMTFSMGDLFSNIKIDE